MELARPLAISRTPALVPLKRSKLISNNQDLWLRIEAAEALARIGPAALVALPELLTMIARGPSPADPRGMEQRYLSFAVFGQMLPQGPDRSRPRTSQQSGHYWTPKRRRSSPRRSRPRLRQTLLRGNQTAPPGHSRLRRQAGSQRHHVCRWDSPSSDSTFSLNIGLKREFLSFSKSCKQTAGARADVSQLA